MADPFNPRGSPVPSNSYDGWELTHRPAMLPFLAEYTNPLGETSGGWAMPEMVTEPVNALSRLLNTPAGTMPDPRDPQNQSDALTGLMALYGGNALGGVARNAMSRGVARGLDMEAARPVAYSNAIDEAMSNPNMLSMMRDIDYANLNRRALDEYGVGYEGLSSSQEAKLRGWSDPALWSDTGKPNPVGAGVASSDRPSFTAYHGSPHDFDKFDMSKIGSGEGAQAYGHGLYFADSEGVAKSYRDALSTDGLGTVARGRLRQNGGDIDKTIEYLRGRNLEGVNNRQALAELEQAKAAGSPNGHMYQVRINADPNDFLNYDAPISEQGQAVKAMIESGWGPEMVNNPNVKGRDFVPFSTDESLMQRFKDAGIPGIKYLDQGSRTAGEGSRNYVVFDDSLIEILKKYGLLAPGAAVGANALMPPDKNQ